MIRSHGGGRGGKAGEGVEWCGVGGLEGFGLWDGRVELHVKGAAVADSAGG